MSDLLTNKIKTPDGTILESLYTHHYVTHLDANGFKYMVDGGLSYARRSLNKEFPYTELSVTTKDSHYLIREEFTWGNNYDEDGNLLEKPCRIRLKDMSTEHIISILNGKFASEGKVENVFKSELAYRSCT